ncbi:MAG: alcohol dehydrogenase catalytic domain-containing protein [Candidatus Liptonbacteria bacterium]|nr:alcohol dehydrogenase catalytic domain-containing protein [Candidatus Liptonbacteria bacterium]
MRALIFRGPNDYSVEEKPIPQIGEGEMLLKIIACGLCGTDVKVFGNGHRAITPPRTTGHEIVGTVAESKSDKAGVVKGDNVLVVAPIGCMKCSFCLRGEQNICPVVVEKVHAFGYDTDGGFAEYLLIPKEAAEQGVLIKIPETEIPLTLLAVAEPLACVLNGQEKLRIGPDDVVVVIGAGPIGSMNVIAARAEGAKKIILADIDSAKLALASVVHPDVSVDSSKENLVERVRKETDGRGADVVIVAAPAPALQTEAIEMAAVRARVSFFAGLAKGTVSPIIDTNKIHYWEIEVYGAFGACRKQYEKAMQLIISRPADFQALVTHTMPLGDIKKAVDLMKTGQTIKVVIAP